MPHEDNDLTITLSKLSYQIESLREQAMRFEKSLDIVKVEVSEIHDAANRWRGGFLVILAIGGMIGWAAAIVPNFAKVWR